MKNYIIILFVLVALPELARAQAKSIQPNWAKLEEETMKHFQAIIRINSADPPGNEAPVVEYLKSVLDKEGIPSQVFSLDPRRPNLVARQRAMERRNRFLSWDTRMW